MDLCQMCIDLPRVALVQRSHSIARTMTETTKTYVRMKRTMDLTVLVNSVWSKLQGSVPAFSHTMPTERRPRRRSGKANLILVLARVLRSACHVQIHVAGGEFTRVEWCFGARGVKQPRSIPGTLDRTRPITSVDTSSTRSHAG